jgi:hypothetical protein
VKSRYLASISACVLLFLGLALLFAADDILPLLWPGFPSTAGWIGQLLGVSWISLGAINWMTRVQPLGGIYGRPVVFANAGLYMMGLSVVAKVVGVHGSGLLWIVVAAHAALAVGYGYLLFFGPFKRDRAG